MHLTQDIVNVMIGLIILIGAIECLFGYKIFKFILGLTGFLVGGALAGAIDYAISEQVGEALLAGLLGGFIGAALLVVFYFVGIFLIGAFLGVVLGVILSAVAQSNVGPAELLILGVIVGVVSLIFQKFMIIISTGFGGAWLVVTGIAHFTLTNGERLLIASDPRNIELLFRSGGSLLYAIVLCWLALGIVGVIVQYKSPSKKEEETQPPAALEGEKSIAEVPNRTPRYLGAIGTIAFLLAIALLFFLLAKSSRSPGRALRTGQHPSSESASTVAPQPTRVGIIEAPAQTAGGTVDVDWHIGPFAGLYLGMNPKELPNNLVTNLSSEELISSTFQPDEKSRLSFLQFCLDRKHLYLSIPLKHNFTLFNIPSDRQELLFVGDINWNLLLGDIAKQIGNDSFQPDRSSEEGFQTAVLGSKLTYITVFPTEENRGGVPLILTQHFAREPQTTKSPPVDFYFITREGSVDTLTFWYVSHNWSMGRMIVECLEIHENERTTASYVVIRSLHGAAPNQLPKGFADSKGILSPEAISSFMNSLKTKSWRVGYGWVRETLGPPLAGLNPWGLLYWPTLWDSNKNNLLYIVDFGRVFRYISLSFDEQGLLARTSLFPKMEGDAPFYATKSPYMSDGNRGDIPEAMAERLRQLLVPEERILTWDGGKNPSGSTWHQSRTIVNVTPEAIITESKTFRFADIDKVEKSDAWSKNDPGVAIRLYPSYQYNSLRLYDLWRSEKELDEIIELIERLSSQARSSK